MLPKVQFVHSWVYDDHLVRSKRSQNPSPKKIAKFKQSLEGIWKKEGKEVLKSISKAAGIDWKERHINVYLTDYAGYFSYPLTLSISEKNRVLDVTFLFDILVHEFIHRIWPEEGNQNNWKGNWRKLYRKYKNESFNVKLHIGIHAIHKHVYLSSYTKERLQRDIRTTQKDKRLKDYARAWEIVERDGYEEIIKQLNPKFKKQA